MQPHNFVYSKRQHEEYTVYDIDTDKSTFYGQPWQDLGDYGRRKFENLLVINNSKEKIKFNYKHSC